MRSGSREMQVSGPVKEATVIGPKIAAVERRKARVPVTRHAGAFAKVPRCDLRRSGAPPPSGEATEDRANARSRDRVIWQSAQPSRGAEEACVDGDD